MLCTDITDPAPPGLLLLDRLHCHPESCHQPDSSNHGHGFQLPVSCLLSPARADQQPASRQADSMSREGMRTSHPPMSEQPVWQEPAADGTGQLPSMPAQAGPSLAAICSEHASMMGNAAGLALGESPPSTDAARSVNGSLQQDDAWQLAASQEALREAVQDTVGGVRPSPAAACAARGANPQKPEDQHHWVEPPSNNFHIPDEPALPKTMSAAFRDMWGIPETALSAQTSLSLHDLGAWADSETSLSSPEPASPLQGTADRAEARAPRPPGMGESQPASAGPSSPEPSHVSQDFHFQQPSLTASTEQLPDQASQCRTAAAASPTMPAIYLEEGEEAAQQQRGEFPPRPEAPPSWRQAHVQEPKPGSSLAEAPSRMQPGSNGHGRASSPQRHAADPLGMQPGFGGCSEDGPSRASSPQRHRASPARMQHLSTRTALLLDRLGMPREGPTGSPASPPLIPPLLLDRLEGAIRPQPAHPPHMSAFMQYALGRGQQHQEAAVENSAHPATGLQASAGSLEQPAHPGHSLGQQGTLEELLRDGLAGPSEQPASGGISRRPQQLQQSNGAQKSCAHLDHRESPWVGISERQMEGVKAVPGPPCLHDVGCHQHNDADQELPAGPSAGLAWQQALLPLQGFMASLGDASPSRAGGGALAIPSGQPTSRADGAAARQAHPALPQHTVPDGARCQEQPELCMAREGCEAGQGLQPSSPAAVAARLHCLPASDQGTASVSGKDSALQCQGETWPAHPSDHPGPKTAMMHESTQTGRAAGGPSAGPEMPHTRRSKARHCGPGQHALALEGASDSLSPLQSKQVRNPETRADTGTPAGMKKGAKRRRGRIANPSKPGQAWQGQAQAAWPEGPQQGPGPKLCAKSPLRTCARAASPPPFRPAGVADLRPPHHPQALQRNSMAARPPGLLQIYLGPRAHQPEGGPETRPQASGADGHSRHCHAGNAFQAGWGEHRALDASRAIHPGEPQPAWNTSCVGPGAGLAQQQHMQQQEPGSLRMGSRPQDAVMVLRLGAARMKPPSRLRPTARQLAKGVRDSKCSRLQAQQRAMNLERQNLALAQKCRRQTARQQVRQAPALCHFLLG